MSFWSGQTLKRRAAAEKLIDPFDEKRIDCSAYTLRVGYEAFVSRDRSDQAKELVQGRTPGHLVASKEETMAIPSGQFAFLIAKEKVRIPNDAIGFISLKSSRKWRGLVNVSGFHVVWKAAFCRFQCRPQHDNHRPGRATVFAVLL